MKYFRFKNEVDSSTRYLIEAVAKDRWNVVAVIFASQEDYSKVKSLLDSKDEVVLGGFELLENETIEASYDNYKFIYESIEQGCYLGLCNGEIIFYDFLVPDDDTYVRSITMRINQDSEDGLCLYRSGMSKDYEEWEFNLFDEYGYPLYKIVDGELVDTTEQEREEHRLKVSTEAFKSIVSAKIDEINTLCGKFITEGVEVDGVKYSYTLEDQSNMLTAMQIALATNMSVPYHANGQNCSLHSPEAIVNLYALQSANLTHHITYSNQLKLYVENELTTQDEVESVVYGQELTGHYLSTYNEMVAQAQQNADAYIASLSASGVTV